MEPGERPPRLRWVICGLLFLATTINYIDRQVLGILAVPLQRSIGWSESDYGLIVTAFQAAYAQWGLWIILIKGLTPIPYKLVTIASGIAHFNLGVFILASLLTRGARFFLVAALLRAYGPPIRDFIERRLTLVTSVFGGLIVLGFVALRFL